MHRTPQRFFLLGFLCLGFACETASDPPEHFLPVDTVGDTLILGDQRDGQWPTHRTLELDLLIGGLEDEDQPTFGRVSDIALESSGGILVEDNLGVAVLRFAADGVLIDSLGRKGEGPGEYLYPQGIALLEDGRIVIRDSRLFRFQVFGSDGAFIEAWQLRALNRGTWNLDADADGSLVLNTTFSRPPPFTPREEGIILLSPDGLRVDSIPAPDTPWDEKQVWGEFHPEKHFAWHSSDLSVVGVSDAYHFDIHRPDRTIRVKRPYDPIPISAEERGAWDIEMAWRTRRGPVGLENIQPPPDHKAPYSRILVTRTGQIWVFRHGPGQQWTTQDLGSGLIWPRFREPLKIDVFDRDGIFLGVVEGEANIDPRIVSNDTLWAVVTGEFEENYVARYLIR